MSSGIYILTAKDSDGVVLSKVGLSVDVHARLQQHNSDGYAGIFNWKMHDWIAVAEADLNQAEKAVHRVLREFNVSYWSANGSVTREVFQCRPAMAWGCAVHALMNNDGSGHDANWGRCWNVDENIIAVAKASIRKLKRGMLKDDLIGFLAMPALVLVVAGISQLISLFN
jgi:hypothetical protein